VRTANEVRSQRKSLDRRHQEAQAVRAQFDADIFPLSRVDREPQRPLKRP